jgi:hypothetical protein
VSLSDLIRADLLRPPLQLEKSYKGRRLTAEVDKEGMVKFGREKYNSLSTSAGAARATVIGTPQGRKYPQTNGWTFWQFLDTDGTLRPVDDLRQRFLVRGAPVIPMDVKRQRR